MQHPPRGWYYDTPDAERLRWWDGVAWTDTYKSPKAIDKSKLRATVAAAVLLGLVGLLLGGVGGALIMIGISAVIISVSAIYRGNSQLLRTHSRRGGLAALALSLAVVGVGGAVSPPAVPTGPAASVETVESNSPTPRPSVSVTHRREQTTATIPFSASEIDDPGLLEGKTRIVTQGVDGVLTTTWIVKIVDGLDTERDKLSEEVTEAPIEQVTAVGTKPKPTKPRNKCDSHYSGVCVPIASDVDCAGGSGNGPAYVSGPVRVTGSDIYDLDRDGDGIACD